MATIPGYCSQCHCRCGTLVHLDDDGRIQKITPDRAHPNGGICAIGAGLKDLPTRPDRLVTPLMRTRPKSDSDPGFREVSWDEALSFAADRIRHLRERFGGSALAFLKPTGAGTASADWQPLLDRLAWMLGTPNLLGTKYLCNYGRDGLSQPMLGHMMPEPDLRRAKTIVILGHNPANTASRTMRRLREAVARGAKLVVVDPQRSETARMATQWLAPYPGTDAHLLKGAVHHVLAEGAFDADFVRCFTDLPAVVDSGRYVRDPRGRVLAITEEGSLAPLGWPGPDDLEWQLDGVGEHHTVFGHLRDLVGTHRMGHVAAVTGIPDAELARFYRDIASPETAFFGWNGLEQHPRGQESTRWLVTLMALLGSLDHPGGNLRPQGPQAADIRRPAGYGPRTPAIDGLGHVFLGGAIPMGDFNRAVLQGDPYPVYGLLAFGGSALIQNPDVSRTAQALATLSFHLRADLYLTPEARFADVVLPAASFLESPALKIGFGRLPIYEEGGHVQFRPAMVAPPGEARPDLQIILDLAKALGYGDDFFDGNSDAVFSAMLEPTGIGLEELKASPHGITLPADPGLERCRRPRAEGGWQGFETMLGRVRCWMEEFPSYGLEPLPEEPPKVVPSEVFPLFLGSRKSRFYCHSEHRNLPELRGRRPRLELDIHPTTAAAYNLVSGDWVEVTTASGSMAFPVAVEDSVYPGWLLGEAGWWQNCDALGLPEVPALAWEGSNLNLLAGPELQDPKYGSYALRSIPCRIRKLTKTPGEEEMAMPR